MIVRVAIITIGNRKLIKYLLTNNINIVAIIEADNIKTKNKIKNHIQRFLITHRKESIRNISIEEMIPYIYFSKQNEIEVSEWIKNARPDLIVISGMSHLLSDKIIKIPDYGVINYHHSYLPDYRGPNPFFWMYYDYVLNPGITVHYVDKGEDTGDIIYQKRVSINEGEGIFSCIDKMDYVGFELIVRAITDIRSGNAPRLLQNNISNTVRARRILPNEYATLIKWYEWDVKRVWHFLQGTPKYWNQLITRHKIIAGGYTIDMDNYSEDNVVSKPSGKIIRTNGNHYIQCLNGIISVKVKFSLSRMLINMLK